MEKVSVIIPTFNRFKYLLNTIESVKNQTYTNLEIIVINDRSSQPEYYNYNWEANNIIIINLDKNSKDIFGFPCPNYVRNEGIKKSTGKYIAICDDDDLWFPKKIELQIDAMKKTGCKMSSTDGLFGKGVYDPNKTYKKYNAEHFYNILQNIYRRNNSNLLENGFPQIWNLFFLKIHNCMIASSVIIDKEIVVNYQCFKNEPCQTGDDYRAWLTALQYTDSVYVDDICFYYDSGHGDGQNY